MFLKRLFIIGLTFSPISLWARDLKTIDKLTMSCVMSTAGTPEYSLNNRPDEKIEQRIDRINSEQFGLGKNFDFYLHPGMKMTGYMAVSTEYKKDAQGEYVRTADDSPVFDRYQLQFHLFLGEPAIGTDDVQSIGLKMDIDDPVVGKVYTTRRSFENHLVAKENGKVVGEVISTTDLFVRCHLKEVSTR